MRAYLGFLFLLIIFFLGVQQEAFAGPPVPCSETQDENDNIIEIIMDDCIVNLNTLGGNDQITVNIHTGNVFIDAGDDDDTILLTSIIGDVTVIAGPGNDEITITAVTGDVTVQGGDDNDIIEISGVTGFIVVDGGAGTNECTVPQSATVTNCGEQQTSQLIGGKIIPIDTISLILVGTQSTSWLIPVVLSIAGIGLVFLRRQN